MKILMTFLLILLSSFMTNKSIAQKFSTFIGLGIGDNIEKKFPFYSKKERGRVVLTVSEYFQVKESISIGVEGNVSGRLFSVLGGTPGVGDKEETANNTLWKNNNNLSANSLFVKGRYAFVSQNKLKPYVELGLGVNTYYFNLFVNDVTKLKQRQFVVKPEFGFNVARFRLAINAIIGGRTPGYDDVDRNSNTRVVLRNISSHQVYLKTEYRLFGKSRK